jgi:hypothetical protein
MFGTVEGTMRLICALAASSVVSACALFTSLDGFSDGTDDGTGEEARPADGLTADAGTDGTPADGTPADGAPQADASPGSFCVNLGRTPLVCADFDDGDLPGDMEVRAVGGATVAIDQVASVSPPSSLLFAIPATSEVTVAWLRRRLPPSLNEIVVELDLRVDQRGEGNFDVLAIYDGIPRIGFELNADGSVAFDEREELEGGGSASRKVLAPKGYTEGAWLHVKWTTVIDGAAAQNSLSFDGEAAGSIASSSAPFGDSSRIIVGEREIIAPAAPWHVRIDNLVIDVK